MKFMHGKTKNDYYYCLYILQIGYEIRDVFAREVVHVELYKTQDDEMEWSTSIQIPKVSYTFKYKIIYWSINNTLFVRSFCDIFLFGRQMFLSINE